MLDAKALAKEAARDAGRGPILDALGRVRIAALTRSEATTIAKAIERLGGSSVAARLTGD